MEQYLEVELELLFSEGLQMLLLMEITFTLLLSPQPLIMMVHLKLGTSHQVLMVRHRLLLKQLQLQILILKLLIISKLTEPELLLATP
jgi:hypothetical protein